MIHPDDPLTPDSAARHKGDSVCDGESVDKLAGCGIVGTVDNHIES